MFLFSSVCSKLRARNFFFPEQSPHTEVLDVEKEIPSFAVFQYRQNLSFEPMVKGSKKVACHYPECEGCSEREDPVSLFLTPNFAVSPRCWAS